MLAAAAAVFVAAYTNRISLRVPVSRHRHVAPPARLRPRPVPERAPVKTPHRAAVAAAPKSAPQPAATPSRARVTRKAASASWLQVRRATASGPVVYEGTLASGSSRRFAASRLWIRFGWANGVELWANGSRVRASRAPLRSSSLPRASRRRDAMIDPETTSIDEGTPCANCGAPLLEDWLFCAACGAPKTAGEADAPELAETTE